MSIPNEPVRYLRVDPWPRYLRRPEQAEIEALERLLKIAASDTGQSARVANFLLAWWNATRDGGFAFTDLWNVDVAIAQDMVTVFAMVARTCAYPDTLGYGAEFERLVVEWRRPKRRRASR